MTTKFFGDGFDGIEPYTLLTTEEVITRVGKQVEYITNLDPENTNFDFYLLKHWSTHRGSFYDLIKKTSEQCTHFIYAFLDKDFIRHNQTNWDTGDFRHLRKGIFYDFNFIKRKLDQDLKWKIENEHNTITYQCYDMFRKYGVVYPMLTGVDTFGSMHTHKMYFCAHAGLNVPVLFCVNKNSHKLSKERYLYKGINPYFFNGRFLDIVVDLRKKVTEYHIVDEPVF